MNEDYAANRKILYLILFLLIIISLFGLKFYNRQLRENVALKIKILSLNKEKKMPMPWSRLTPVPRAELVPQPQMTKNINLSELSTEQLISELSKKMENFKSLDLENTNKNIELANELISREPANYAAFKAKLISMIVKESKFNQEIDEHEFTLTLESMAGIDIDSNISARREAILLTTNNDQLSALEKKLDDILEARDEVTTLSSGLEKESTEYQELEQQNTQLEIREQLATENLDNFRNSLFNEEISPANFNEDIVEIPFLRLLAKSDYDTVIEDAQSLIDQFPKEIIGYFYKVKALELAGRYEEAMMAIAEAQISSEEKQRLVGKLEASNGEDPAKFWEKLMF